MTAFNGFIPCVREREALKIGSNDERDKVADQESDDYPTEKTSDSASEDPQI